MKHDKPVALITGANQGIGLQIAKDLAAHGLTVLVGSRNFERGEEAAKTIAGDARAIQLDVTDQVSITAAAERIRAELGRLDVLVNNAAISNTTKLPDQSVEEYAKSVRPSNVSLDEMRAVWETNVFGVLAVYQAMLPLLREAPQARIVNVSSGAGSLTMNSNPENPHCAVFGPVYPASKTALNALTKESGHTSIARLLTFSAPMPCHWPGLMRIPGLCKAVRSRHRVYCSSHLVRGYDRHPMPDATQQPDRGTGK